MPCRRWGCRGGSGGGKTPRFSCCATNSLWPSASGLGSAAVGALRFLRRAGEHAGAPRPGLIILDLNLPGLHGLEVLAEIKADPDLMVVPVVVLSSSRNPGDIRRSYELHANAYVVKPEDPDGFDDVIRRIDACFIGLIEPPPPG